MDIKNLRERILIRVLPNSTYKKRNYRKKSLEISKDGLGILLRANASLKDIHKGQRCFILGNGPSLSGIDLSLLKDELTFTVNDLFYKDDFDKLNTTYHLFGDPHYFHELQDILRKLHQVSNPKGIFIESSGWQTMKKQDLDRLYPIHVYANGIEVEDLFFMGADLCKQLPYFSTVVQSAIVIAAYMGFETIYLLGCDCTGILNYMKRVQGKNPKYYAFTLPEEEVKKQQEINITSEHMFFEWYHIFKSYRILREFLNKSNIKLINLTQNSMLDSLEKGNLKDVINS